MADTTTIAPTTSATGSTGGSSAVYSSDAARTAVSGAVGSMGSAANYPTNMYVTANGIKAYGNPAQLSSLYGNNSADWSPIYQPNPTLGSTFNATVGGVNASFDPLIQGQEEKNAAREAGAGVANEVSGRSRYAPEVATAFTQGVQQEDAAKLAQIVGRKTAALNTAQAAYDKGSYEDVTNQMKEYQQAQKDEQQWYMDQQRVQTEQQTNTINQNKYYSQSLAPILNGLMTGDKTHDDALIQSTAKQYGIDPNILAGEVSTYQENYKKDLPTMAAEYKWATDNGYFKGNFMEYMQARSAANRASPNSKVLTVQEANNIGIPALAGQSENEVIQSMTDSNGNVSQTPPRWFLQWFDQNGGKGLSGPSWSSAAQKFWNDKFVNNQTIQDFLKGKNEVNYGSGSTSTTTDQNNTDTSGNFD